MELRANKQCDKNEGGIFNDNLWLASKLKKSDSISSIIVLMLIVIICLYVLQLAYIFQKRHNVVVQTRSPWILLTCGVSLLLDSIINFTIQFSKDNAAECILGIVTTVSFFYIGWAAIALRAYRVKAVFDTYDRYLRVLTDQEKKTSED
jgi:hypothetical protein